MHKAARCRRDDTQDARAQLPRCRIDTARATEATPRAARRATAAVAVLKGTRNACAAHSHASNKKKALIVGLLEPY